MTNTAIRKILTYAAAPIACFAVAAVFAELMLVGGPF